MFGYNGGGRNNNSNLIIFSVFIVGIVLWLMYNYNTEDKEEENEDIEIVPRNIKNTSDWDKKEPYFIDLQI